MDMMATRTVFVLILLFSFNAFAFTLNGVAESKRKVTITTFNIAFYGLGGSPEGSSQTEMRDPYLRAFIKNSIPTSDIIVFEEIVDIERLKTLLPGKFQCLSYENRSATHQHVVICHNDKYNFVREPSDNNDIIDEVAGERGTLRPAVTAIVTDLEGNALFRIVGVHLKAIPNYSATRVNQSGIIGNYLGKLKSSKLPVIITGDFNTYPSPANEQEENDTELILNALNISQMGFKRIPNDLFTFRDVKYGQSQFDQFYLSSGLKATKPLRVFEVCNDELGAAQKSMDLPTYNKNISDHCPVTAEISF
jgi:hypothetical protein